MDYYRIWSFNGQTGCQKFRSQTNFANAHHFKNDDNYFITQYSEEYVEKVIGKTYKTLKMYGAGI